jgi:hypothetical protein
MSSKCSTCKKEKKKLINIPEEDIGLLSKYGYELKNSHEKRVVALKKALYQKPTETIVMHHSDRGIQYCSTEYVNLLQQNNALISMTQNGDPYENAIAERVNGILKTELISAYYETVEHAALHIGRCITIYNYRRRHSSLNWQINDFDGILPEGIRQFIMNDDRNRGGKVYSEIYDQTFLHYRAGSNWREESSQVVKDRNQNFFNSCMQ